MSWPRSRRIAPLLALLPLGLAGTARAEFLYEPTTDTVSVAQTADGPQVVITGSARSDKLFFPERFQRPPDEIYFEVPDTTAVVVAPSARERCTYTPRLGPAFRSTTRTTT